MAMRTAALKKAEIQEVVERAVKKHRAEPGALIQILLEIQSEITWLPREAHEMVSERLRIPLCRVRNVATFFKAFGDTPKGGHEVRVCTGTACHVLGASRILDTVEAITGAKPQESAPGSKFTVRAVNCPGCCASGPVVEIDGKIYGQVTPANLAELLKVDEEETG